MRAVAAADRLTIAFHLVTRYDWFFSGSFQPWRMQTVGALGTLGAPLLAALIVWRQPTNRYGWVWCALGWHWRSMAPPSPTSSGPGTCAPTIQPFGYEATWVGTVMAALALGLVPLVLVLFPTGGPVAALATGGLGDRGRLWALAAVDRGRAGPMNDLTPTRSAALAVRHARRADQVVGFQLGMASPAADRGGCLSLLARLRHARGRQRQQVKWLAYAAFLLPRPW